jgi:hypothetical protein
MRHHFSATAARALLPSSPKPRHRDSSVEEREGWLVPELLDARCAGIYPPGKTGSRSRVMDRRQSTSAGSSVSSQSSKIPPPQKVAANQLFPRADSRVTWAQSGQNASSPEPPMRYLVLLCTKESS